MNRLLDDIHHKYLHSNGAGCRFVACLWAKVSTHLDWKDGDEERDGDFVSTAYGIALSVVVKQCGNCNKFRVKVKFAIYFLPFAIEILGNILELIKHETAPL